MRRSILVLALSVLCLALTPVSAHASFWKWLDDLSGPSFQGVDLEMRLLCKEQKYSDRRVMLETLQLKLSELPRKYHVARTQTSGAEQEHYRLAALEAELALQYATFALANSTDLAKVDDYVVKALASRALAAWHARNAQYVKGGLGPRTSLEDRTSREKATEKLGFLPALGLSFSACRIHPLDVSRRFMTVAVSVAHAPAGEGEHPYDATNMFTIGSTFNWRPVQSITLGAGFGGARFTPKSRSAFWKFYIQPLILDIKPISVKPDSRFRTAWADTFSVRYSVTTFPGGFGAGSFGASSAEYDTEFVQAVGLYIDFDPWVRKLKKKSW